MPEGDEAESPPPPEEILPNAVYDLEQAGRILGIDPGTLRDRYIAPDPPLLRARWLGRRRGWAILGQHLIQFMQGRVFPTDVFPPAPPPEEEG